MLAGRRGGVVLLTGVGFVIASGCVQPSPGEPPGEHVFAINGGRTENGYPATVMLADMSWAGGGMCSGSLVAPRVVISAKHCFENRGNQDPRDLRDWTVLTGPFGQSPEDEYGIEEVLTTPEVQIDNYDIEIVLLDRAVSGTTPYEIRRDLAGMRPSDATTLCGYGENPSGGLMRKYSGEAAIAGFGPIEPSVGENELITIGAAACGGDSGGTVLDGAGQLIGVIVRGATQSCGSPDNEVTAITRIDKFLPLIDEGLQRTGVCVAQGEEVCDGLDNDCDGATDPGCADLFGSCARDDLCRTGVCRDVGDGAICTQACEPAVPVGSCPEGSYCRSVGCGESYCSPGAPGATRAGDACSVDTDCSTLRCREGSCVAGCVPGQGQCRPGEVCAPDGASCDSCLDEASVDGPRGLGEPCEENQDCDSHACANIPGDHYCTTTCDGTCPAGYHCAQGACLRGDLGRDGEPCDAAEECASAVCQAWPNGASCSSSCDPSHACPGGTVCEEIGNGASACRPEGKILGELCENGAECFGNICANWGGQRSCSEACDAADPCPTGFSCLDAGDGVRVCVVEDGADDGGDGGGGCGCRVGRRADSSAAWILIGLVLGIAGRRRKKL